MKTRSIGKILGAGVALLLPWVLLILAEVKSVFVGRVVWQMRVSEPVEPRPIRLTIREYDAGFGYANRYSFGFYDEKSSSPIAGGVFWVDTDSLMARWVLVRKVSDAHFCDLVFSASNEYFIRVEGTRAGGEQKWKINK